MVAQASREKEVFSTLAKGSGTPDSKGTYKTGRRRGHMASAKALATQDSSMLDG